MNANTPGGDEIRQLMQREVLDRIPMLLRYTSTEGLRLQVPDTDIFIIAGPQAWIVSQMGDLATNSGAQREDNNGQDTAPAAATVLTDEQRIFDLAAEHEANRGGLWGPVTFDATGLLDFARSIEREVLAHAGAAAEPAAPVRTIPDVLTVETIQGAIAFGRMGINPPPSPDHWGHEFWQIGRQLAKLGETSVWDNVTPVDVAAPTIPAQAPAADEVRAALDLIERVTGTIYADMTPGYYEATSKVFSFTRSMLDASPAAHQSTANNDGGAMGEGADRG